MFFMKSVNVEVKKSGVNEISSVMRVMRLERGRMLREATLSVEWQDLQL